MKANPDKFQGIMFGNRIENVSFKVKDVIIDCENEVKLLGVFIDSNLKFDKHISYISSKASGQINAIMRLSHRIPVDTKLSMYRAFVMANFNYCPLVWMFCGAANVQKLERLQYRALRFVHNNYEARYEELLEMSGEKTLIVKRMHTLGVEMYKCLNKLSPSYLSEKFNKNETEYNLRDGNRLLKKKVNTKCFGLRTFSYSGAKLWNNLPMEIKNSVTLNEFKERIKLWKTCHCEEWMT